MKRLRRTAPEIPPDALPKDNEAPDSTHRGSTSQEPCTTGANDEEYWEPDARNAQTANQPTDTTPRGSPSPTAQPSERSTDGSTNPQIHLSEYIVSRRLLPIWMNACATGQKLVEFQRYKGRGNFFKSIRAGTMMLLGPIGDKGIPLHAIGITAEEPVVGLNRSHIPAMQMLIPAHLREALLHEYLTPEYKVFDHVSFARVYDLRAFKFTLSSFCAQFQLKAPGGTSGYPEVKSSSPDAAQRIVNWCTSNRVPVHTPTEAITAEPNSKRQRTIAPPDEHEESQPSGAPQTHSGSSHPPASATLLGAPSTTVQPALPETPTENNRNALITALFHRKKPRAFNNAKGIRDGGGSCWINAALQALFAPCALKTLFSELWHDLPLDERRTQQQRIDSTGKIRFRNEQPGPRLGDLPFVPEHGPTLEQRLALTFGCAHGGQTTNPMTPFLVDDLYYHLHQEDAAELLTGRLLNTELCPRLAPVVTTLGVDRLRCASCGHARDPTLVSNNSLQLPIEIEITAHGDAIAIEDVQTALDAYLAPTDIPAYELPCEQCHSHAYIKTYRTTVFPQVLVLTLKRVKYIRLPSGECTGPHGVLHSVEATQTLNFQGQLYDLRSVIVHLGEHVHAGHDFAVTRHATDNGTWWLYDDRDRREAQHAQISTVGLCHRTGEQMKSSVLFYEKRATP